ncbi:MAG TPA: hypothetical protein VNH18_07245, partial [Bryobacteraceae bacterium]|nr:hypothetical protein [Bryobacteraceae bacterium]
VMSGLAQSKLPNQPLTNKDIIGMSAAGVPQNTILTAIQTTPVNFDVSAAGLIALHAGGVAERVLNQMIAASGRVKFAASFGVATGSFPVKEAVGKTIRFSTVIKTDNVLNGYAGLWWRVDGEKGKILAFDNSQARLIGETPAPENGTVRGATGTNAWKKYELELPVPDGATNINFGLLLTGTGTAWFDTLKIDLDGAPYINPQRIDLDFESTMAKGFYTGGNGYRVGVDNSGAWTGSQSLKMQFIGDGGESKTASR